MKKLIKIIVIILLVFILAGMGVTIYLVGIATEAPDLDAASAQPDGYLTTVLDDEENVILTLAGAEANRIYVTLEQIPDQVENAFIAIEDSRFRTHNGIDPKGILRAGWVGITTGNFSQGASTITQQLLKNNVFTSWTSEETFMDKVKRKLQEQYLAIVLEQQKDKEWILENYLNTINLGSGTWGVEAASLRYFNKDVSELSLSEAAVIAGITKNPSGYNPITNPGPSRTRQLQVLGAMLEQGYITQEEFELAQSDPVYERIASSYQEGNIEIFSYFEDALIRSIVEDLMEQHDYTEDEAWDEVYRGGLTIYSTQNSHIQEVCEKEANNDSYIPQGVQASVVVTSVADGSVKGILGGRGKKDASLTMNRAMDSMRQPGSTIKIIGEYAAAMDQKMISLGTVYQDYPMTYSDGTMITNHDGTYNGASTIRRAITLSINTVAVEVFQEVGIDQVCSYLESFGITTLTDADKVEALALGGTSGGVTNFEMTAAYNALANDGEYRKPYFYYKVVDREGNILLEHQEESHRVVSVETAELLTKGMENVMQHGTGVYVNYDDGYSLAAKTGTTNQCKDLWMIGYSPYYTVGVWGGYDTNDAQEDSSYVKYIWKNIMQQSHEGVEGKRFSDDGNLVTRTICIKCGNLAVGGLCDVTVQGDKTYTETFASGLEPRQYCDCHESVEVCGSSEMLKNHFCPKDQCQTKVYLKNALPGTDDEPFCMEYAPKEICDEHMLPWDIFKEKDKEQEKEYEKDNGNGKGNENGNQNGNNQGVEHTISTITQFLSDFFE